MDLSLSSSSRSSKGESTSSLDIKDLLLPVTQINIHQTATSDNNNNTIESPKKDFGMSRPDSEYAFFVSSSNSNSYGNAVSSSTGNNISGTLLHSSSTSNQNSVNTIKITNVDRNGTTQNDITWIDVNASQEEGSPAAATDAAGVNIRTSIKTPTKIPKSNPNWNVSSPSTSSSRKNSKIQPPSLVMGRKVLIYDSNNDITNNGEAVYGQELKLESPILSVHRRKPLSPDEKEYQTSSGQQLGERNQKNIDIQLPLTSNDGSQSPTRDSKVTNNNLVSSRTSKKILLQVLSSDPLNRSCADCKSPLVDSTNIFTSCYKSTSKPRSQQKINWEFSRLHHLYAPPTDGTEDAQEQQPTYQPRQLFNRRRTLNDTEIYEMIGGGFAVFLCKRCSASHLQMSRELNGLTVKNIMNDSYTQTEMSQLRNGGNAHVRTVYEHALSSSPNKYIYSTPLTNTSTLAERQIFCRYKYEALQYLFSSQNIASPNNTIKDGMFLLPNRLVDFFCVVSADSKCTLESSVKLENTKSLNDLRLEPTVIDCVPSTEKLPTHVAKFVFPDGLTPKQQPEGATFFSFCLTSEQGARIYGGVLHIYDDAVDLSNIVSPHLSDVDGDEKIVPTWLDASSQHQHSDLKSSTSSNPNNSNSQNRLSDVVFIPKALVVLSHYGFFHVWRKVLQQIYRISLLEAPLPMERYINNFVSEVPLPPQGRVEVQFGGLLENITISRPAVNRLPLANFSYAPLFSTLSVSNTILVVTYLLQEQKVCLCSAHYPLLTPICEALLSLLFPFSWQGMYIPITPYHMCMDILEAPVPYLLGIHSRYLTQVSRRPPGVIFVDLDNDVVHIDNETSIPALPENHAAKLKNKLHQFADRYYLPTSSGWKGRIFRTHTTNDHHNSSSKPIPNSSRESYCHQIYMETRAKKDNDKNRAARLAQVEKAFGDHEQLNVSDGFATDVGTLLERDVKKEDTWKIRGMKKQKGPHLNNNTTKIQSKLRKLTTGTQIISSINTAMSNHIVSLDESEHSSISNQRNRLNSGSMDEIMPTSTSELHLLELVEADEIRNAFLRFLVALFLKYGKYLDKNRHVLDVEKFVSDQFTEPGTGQFMILVCQTQMMDVFSRESCLPEKPAHVRFFQESIVAKNNRSMKQKWKKGKKEVTPFLVDESHAITETFTPPPPSNWGLPDDGRTYHYASFPKLQSNLYGKTRPPKQWSTNNASRTQLLPIPTPIAQQRSIQFLSHIFDEEEDTLEWAIHALSNSNPLNDYDHPIQIKAQSIIASARRKQGIQLVSIVRLQSYFRMCLEKRRFEKLKSGVTVLQRTIQKKPLSQVEENYLLPPGFLHSILLIQRMVRDRQKKRKAATAIQYWFRSIYAKNYWKGLKHSITIVQSVHRRRRAQFVYLFVIRIVTKVQAVIRGCMTRKHVKSFIQRRWNQYRKQMFELWKHARTPLVYRSKFWLLVNHGSSFLDLALVQNEMRRLWEDLGIVHSTPIGNITEVSDIPLYGFGRVLAGLSALTFYQFLQVNTLLDKRSGAKTAIKGIMAIFPAELANHDDVAALQAKGMTLTMASDRLDSERLQIYEKLTTVATSNPKKAREIYQHFGITDKDSLKKQRLVNQLLWDSYNKAMESANALLVLFPELIDTTNINYIKPSKKGRKLFHVKKSQQILSPLISSMNVETKIDQLIIQDLREVGVSFLSPRTSQRATAIHKRQQRYSYSSYQFNAIFYPNEWCRAKQIPLPEAQKIMQYIVVQQYLFG